MNERIRELAEQAGGEFYTGFAGSPNSVKFMEQDFEKFAELIVKECVNVVAVGSFLHDQAPTAIFAIECSAAIKRHFDIK